MKAKICTIFLTLLMLITVGLSTAKAQSNTPPFYNIDFAIKVRPDVGIQMGAVVVVNPNPVKNGKTIVVVNGTGQTANTFIPFAQRVLSEKVGKKVARFVLINYPGHNNSSEPISTIGFKFGDLTLDDYTTSLIESLKVLRQIGMTPDFAIGHSLGAEMFHLAQDRLIKQGTNLRALGIKGALFLVPDIVGPSPWAFTDSGAAAAVAGQLGINDPDRGMLVRFPPPVFIGLFYGDAKGMVVAGAPTPEEIVAQRLISDDSLQMAAGFLGLLTGTRPQIAPNGFTAQTGTIASLVSLEQDAIYQESEHRALYTFLTGDQSGSMYLPLKGPNTVHNLHLLDTGVYLDILDKTLKKAK